MAMGVTLFIIAVLVIAIWVIIEIKRLKHKIFAIFLIGLILFTYFSFSVVLSEQKIDYTTISGIVTASKLYFSWLTSIFINLKSITTNAIQMSWDGNKTIG